jgi:hypothetical protein
MKRPWQNFHYNIEAMKILSRLVGSAFHLAPKKIKIFSDEKDQ